MSKRLALVYGLAIICTFGIAPGFASADDPLPAPVDLAIIEDLSAGIFKRLDSVAALRARRVELETAAKRAPELLSQAELASNLAKIAAREYRDGIVPQDVNTINGEIKLAESNLLRANDRMEWSNRVLKRGTIAENENLDDRMFLQKCQIALQNAKLKLDVLQNFTIPHELTRLENAVDKAKAEAENAKSNIERTKTELAEIDRQITAASLLPEERQAVQLLDESIGLFDKGKTEAARAKLGEAKARWNEGQAKRMAARYLRIKLRIREEANNRAN
jgi:hypothetical protein